MLAKDGRQVPFYYWLKSGTRGGLDISRCTNSVAIKNFWGFWGFWSGVFGFVNRDSLPPQFEISFVREHGLSHCRTMVDSTGTLYNTCARTSKTSAVDLMLYWQVYHGYCMLGKRAKWWCLAFFNTSSSTALLF